MNTIADLIAAFGGNTKFARIIGKNVSTVSEMKRRNSIPIEYWPAIIRQAPRGETEGLNAEKLMQIHLRERVAA